MHAEGDLCKSCDVENFKTFVEGLHSVRIYEDQTH